MYGETTRYLSTVTSGFRVRANLQVLWILLIIDTLGMDGRPHRSAEKMEMQESLRKG